MSTSPALTLVMYSRLTPCPFVSLAKRVLDQLKVDYREIVLEDDPVYEQHVLDWTGFLSVPTLIIAHDGADLPHLPPTPLMPNSSPRGIDRGTMITEPNEDQLVAWLTRHGLLSGANRVPQTDGNAT